MKYINGLRDIYDEESKEVPKDISEYIDSQVARRKITDFAEGPLDGALSNLFFHLNGNIMTAYHHLINYYRYAVPNHECFAIIKERKPTPLSDSPYIVLMRYLDQERNNLKLTFWDKEESERYDLLNLVGKYDINGVLEYRDRVEAGARICYLSYPIFYVHGNNKKLARWLEGRLHKYAEQTILSHPAETQQQLRKWIKILKQSKKHEKKHEDISNKYRAQARDLLSKIEQSD